MQEEIIFHERQHFNRWLIFLIILSSNAFPIFFCITQVGMGKSWGNNPMSDTTLIIFTASMIILLTAFFFLRNKFFPWDMISKAYIRKYNPVTESRGWGIKYRKFNKWFNIRGVTNFNIIYTMSGNIGLQLELTDGKLVLIGTHNPDEMEDVLRKLEKWQE